MLPGAVFSAVGDGHHYSCACPCPVSHLHESCWLLVSLCAPLGFFWLKKPPCMPGSAALLQDAPVPELIASVSPLNVLEIQFTLTLNEMNVFTHLTESQILAAVFAQAKIKP